MKISESRSCLTACPAGHIDSTTAPALEEALFSALSGHPGLPLQLNLSGVTYISSAGLRLLMALSRRCSLTLTEVSPEVYETLQITGFTQLFPVKKRMRELSLEGCPVIGEGAIGTVYRLDADTIVKLYKSPDCLPMIENELLMSRKAFLRGIPTAIPFDVVRVGESYGTVFELVKAQSLDDLLIAEPERQEELTRAYVELLKRTHEVEMTPGELPDARDIYLGYLDQLGGVLPEAISARVRALLKEMPASLHPVHGDLQPKNVMMSDGEPLLIDMDTLSAGDPVFEFAGLYTDLIAFDTEEPGNSMAFFGLSSERTRRLFEDSLSGYLGSPEAAEAALPRIRVLSDIRFLYLLTVLRIDREDLRELRVRRVVGELPGLLAGVDGLGMVC
ncbi:MAG: phosphotransferase [Clostridia bacterium]|nr:phosphotransferase [Clostridia bacterium]